MTKIKLCGLSRPCDIQWVNELKPDYIGFVFAPKSKRYVSPERAYELRAMLDPGITSVGVFVNAEPEWIASLVKAGTIGAVQLHGSEDEAYIQTLRRSVGCPIIQAFSVSGQGDIERARESSADWVLLDNGKGGTGEAFDWALIHGIGRDYFLAGGLDAERVGKAVKKYRPYAVDVSSGIETDGVKNFDKMKKFVAAARAACAEE